MSSVTSCLPVCLYICLFLFSLFSFVALSLRSLFDEIALCRTNKLLNLTELMELPLVGCAIELNSAVEKDDIHICFPRI